MKATDAYLAPVTLRETTLTVVYSTIQQASRDAGSRQVACLIGASVLVQAGAERRTCEGTAADRRSAARAQPGLRADVHEAQRTVTQVVARRSPRTRTRRTRNSEVVAVVPTPARPQPGSEWPWPWPQPGSAFATASRLPAWPPRVLRRWRSCRDGLQLSRVSWQKTAITLEWTQRLWPPDRGPVFFSGPRSRRRCQLRPSKQYSARRVQAVREGMHANVVWRRAPVLPHAKTRRQSPPTSPHSLLRQALTIPPPAVAKACGSASNCAKCYLSVNTLARESTNYSDECRDLDLSRPSTNNDQR